VKKALCVVLLLCACKSGPQPSGASAIEDATRYYPLAVGNSWTYAFRGSDRQETIRIIGQDGPWFIDDHRGRLRYEKDGVRDADRYLLRTPLAAGSKWSAVDNLAVQRFEVVSMDASAVTQAGTFTNCAVIRNEQPLKKGGKFVTEWTYARKVGLVLLVTSTLDPQGRQQEQTRMQLVAYRAAQ
jgi:hypothetical protein